jgi:hypothetical protein
MTTLGPRRAAVAGSMFLTIVVLLAGCSLSSSSELPESVERLVRRAVMISQEPFLLEAQSGPVAVREVPPERLQQMQEAILPTLSTVYAGGLLQERVRQLAPLLEPGREASPFVTGWEVTRLDIDGITNSADGIVVTGTAEGWVARPELGTDTVNFGETFRFTVASTPSGPRIVAEQRECIPKFCP